MENKTTSVIIGILLLVVVILVGFILYAFVLRPAVTGYVVDKQITAYNAAQIDVMNGILTQLQQTGYVQLRVGNQTLILAPVQQQAPQQ